MHFLDPAALLLSGLALPLVMLYFIRARRRDRTVSSLLLWPAQARERASTAFFQKLQFDPLLLLQLAALAALAIAVGRPAITVMGEADHKVVVVLDASASMKARDVSPSRFAEAQSRAVDFVRQLRPGTQVMVIEAGIQPNVVLEMGRELGRAVDAIEKIEPRDIPNHLEDALRISRSLIGEDPRAEGVVRAQPPAHAGGPARCGAVQPGASGWIDGS